MIYLHCRLTIVFRILAIMAPLAPYNVLHIFLRITRCNIMLVPDAMGEIFQLITFISAVLNKLTPTGATISSSGSIGKQSLG